jgi:hypothetical protein
LGIELALEFSSDLPGYLSIRFDLDPPSKKIKNLVELERSSR